MVDLPPSRRVYCGCSVILCVLCCDSDSLRRICCGCCDLGSWMRRQASPYLQDPLILKSKHVLRTVLLGSGCGCPLIVNASCLYLHLCMVGQLPLRLNWAQKFASSGWCESGQSG